MLVSNSAICEKKKKKKKKNKDSLRIKNYLDY